MPYKPFPFAFYFFHARLLSFPIYIIVGRLYCKTTKFACLIPILPYPKMGSYPKMGYSNMGSYPKMGNGIIMYNIL